MVALCVVAALRGGRAAAPPGEAGRAARTDRPRAAVPTVRAARVVPVR
ncbi:hypothetical protein OG271_24370 [Micromonospora rifamycinica]|nr:hypothetical protein [Micromonospora rifamycinica]